MSTFWAFENGKQIEPSSFWDLHSRKQQNELTFQQKEETFFPPGSKWIVTTKLDRDNAGLGQLSRSERLNCWEVKVNKQKLKWCSSWYNCDMREKLEAKIMFAMSFNIDKIVRDDIRNKIFIEVLEASKFQAKLLHVKFKVVKKNFPRLMDFSPREWHHHHS